MNNNNNSRNNTNNNNNRRRGRGNRNQSGGTGSQLNRIDSRARGNAPQMLDKFKKLAQDAQHNGDRVQMEYYLQFADHYFRVTADNKARVDEQRGGVRRPDDRNEAEDYNDDDFDFDRGRRSEQPTRSPYEQPDNDPRGDTLEGEPGQEGEPFLADDRSNDRSNDRGDDRDDTRPRGPRRQPQQRKPRENARENGRDDNRGEKRAERPERGERPERAAERSAERPAERSAERPAERPAERSAERSVERPAERSEKPARVRKPRKAADDDRGGNQGGIDSSILPPSIRGDDNGSSDGALETVG